MVFGLAVIWVHPYQACMPTLDEVTKNLALLTTSHENWAYAYVQFNKDALHVLLPKEGYHSTMTEGAPSRNTCGHPCQLEVCLLLPSECQVLYPEGLNGVLELVVKCLPESLTHGMNILDEPTFLLVDLSQFIAGNYAFEASAPHDTLTPTSPTHFTVEDPLGSRATSAWLLRSRSSCHMQCWTPPAKPWRVPLQKGQHLQPWGLHHLLKWKTLPSH